jgi:CPA2 family monovalent cation:H+ antiporter-2
LADALRRFVFQGTPRQRYCRHLDLVGVVETPPPVCPQCAEGSDEWVHVRMCLICGELGCCDSSTSQHAREHFEETGHPVFRSVEPGEHWGWCYEDKVYLRGSDFLV